MNLNRTSNIAALALAATMAVPAAPAQQYAAPNQPDYQPADSQNQSQNDPPSRVARIALVQGNVSLEPAGVDTFSQAELNYPLTAGDRLYADNSSMSELQTDGLAIRLGNGADLTLSSLTDQVAQFGLAQGSIRLRTRDLQAPDGTQATVEVDTPNGTILVTRTGDIRIDSYPQDDTTVVTVTQGQVELTGPNLDTTLNPGQSLRLAGTNPVYTQALRLLPPDQLDNFDTARENERTQSLRVSQAYVDPGIIGVADLGNYGDWSPNPDYGAVWFPRAVPAAWTPYSNGHWAWVAPWGWTWIEAEPWGFAPFHYGRWAAFDGRWGWVPGPPPALFEGRRAPRPIYSPALVAFVGGPRFSISVGFGGQSGAGVTAWFPLGPREAYHPWYHASDAYVNRVNVTNLYTRNAVEVRNNYNNRTTNVYNTNVTNVTYINRPAATVAVAQRDFASGHGVAQSQHIRMDQNTQRQLAQAPILPHPLVTPQPGAAAPQTPARALPPNQARPVVETRQGFERAGQRAGQPTDRQNQPGTPNGNQSDAPTRVQPGDRNQPGPATNQPGSQRTSQYGGQTNGGAIYQPGAQPGSPAPAQQPVPIVRGQPVQTARQPVNAQPSTPPPPVQTPPMVHNQPVQTGRQPMGNQPANGQPAANQPTQQQPQQGGFRGGNYPQQRDHTPVTPTQPPVTQPRPNQPPVTQPQPNQAPPTQPTRTFGGANNPQRPVYTQTQPTQTFGGANNPQRPVYTQTQPTQTQPTRPQPQPNQPQPNQPQPNQPQPTRPQPQPNQPQPTRPTPTSAPTPAQEPQQYNLGRPVQRAPETPRPLINRTEPQPVQPSFPAQQRAIQATDPGRPLGPQQVQNLRQGKPAGPPTQPEPTVHPPATATPRPKPNAPQ